MTARVEVLGSRRRGRCPCAPTPGWRRRSPRCQTPGHQRARGFTDLNGTKSGLDIRCAITVNLRGRRRFHVEHLTTTRRQALDEALTKLERRLVHTEESDRDSRRRPTKYYATRLTGRRT